MEQGLFLYSAWLLVVLHKIQKMKIKDVLFCSGKKCCALCVSTPEYVEQVSPEVITRWVATENPVLFRLQRIDYVVDSIAEATGFLELTLPVEFEGSVGDSIAVYSEHDGKVYTGLVTGISSPAYVVTTDIVWNVNFDIEYLNNDTEHGGYYFEVVLTINDIEQSIHVIASPNSIGWADIDVSGLLRIAVKMTKTGDYSEVIMKEPNKSGKFTLKFRECWYGSSEAYVEEGNDWYYAEGVRTAEQGANLHEYVTDPMKFYNLFEKPVYFTGKPFDISFILPTHEAPAEITVTIKVYDSSHTLLDTISEVVTDTTLQGYLNSLTIPAITQGSYMTVEIE